MAERRLPGLQRVLGVNALCSTAYGNVGSSICYALGLVAVPQDLTRVGTSA
jgi:basic amino acid/polyamine antiporter, APA family